MHLLCEKKMYLSSNYNLITKQYCYTREGIQSRILKIETKKALQKEKERTFSLSTSDPLDTLSTPHYVKHFYPPLCINLYI